MDFTTTMMASRYRHTCFLLLALLFSLQLTAGLAAYRVAGGVTVYWGRNRDEGTLREACDTGEYTTVIISFLSAFGHGKYTLDLSGHDIAGIGDDIDYCKHTKGVFVLLSIGGQGGEYSLPSSQAAADLADYLWNAFLGGSRAGVVRPFGDASVDGIDFFIDQGATEHYDELARHLYFYNKYYRAWSITLTATPRCGFPDQRLAAALDTGLFNHIHVRLYGEDRRCAQTPRESGEKWQKWAAAHTEATVLVGAVASPEADATAYMSPSDLRHRVLHFAEKQPSFGGVMIWNRYYDKKTNFSGGL